jgi:hypothetical protein
MELVLQKLHFMVSPAAAVLVVVVMVVALADMILVLVVVGVAGFMEEVLVAEILEYRQEVQSVLYIPEQLVNFLQLV